MTSVPIKLIFPVKQFFVLLLVIAWAPLHAQQYSTPSDLVPLFTLEDMDGNNVSLEDFRGKIVMINFWATYCPPCIEEMPTMQALLESLSDKPFAILAINMGEDREKIQGFLDRIGAKFEYPLLLDQTMEVASDYQVSALPATLLIDKQGRYVFGGVGARDWNGPEARDQVLALFEN